MFDPPPKMGIGDILVFVLALLLIDIVTFGNCASICDLDDTPAFPRVLIYNSSSCYFLVNDSRYLTYPNFTLELARNICQSHNATLPSIHSEEENDFLVKYFKYSQGITFALNIVIGLIKVQDGNSSKYEWDDKSNVTYNHKFWKKAKGEWQYTVVTPDDMWIEVDNITDTIGFRKFVHMVCKQPYESPPLTVPVELPVPVPTSKTNCDDDKKKNYSKALWHNDKGTRVCYFVVPDATAWANQKSRHSGKMEFDFARARSICSKHGGSLPIIHKFEEAEFIRKQVFDLSDHMIRDPDRSGIFPLVVRIALGLLQVKTASGYDYKWEDQSVLSFSPKKWPNKTESAPFTVMDSQNVDEWYNGKDKDKNTLAAVICRQAYAEPPKPPGTPKATQKPDPLATTKSTPTEDPGRKKPDPRDPDGAELKASMILIIFLIMSVNYAN